MVAPARVGEAPRLAFVDALKAVAVQLIVLHHLAFYGPLSDNAYDLAPALIVWLSDYARMAVQAFLVIGGFLAARSLAPAGTLLAPKPLAMLWRRYLHLVTPYLAAVLLGIAFAAIARALMDHHSVPGPPTLPQVLAHTLLLQSILGYEGLSAGAWYIAIDFQLFALLLGALWLARGIGHGGARTPLLGALLVTALALASLYHFNRDAALGHLGTVLLRGLCAGGADVLGDQPPAGRRLAGADGSGRDGRGAARLPRTDCRCAAGGPGAGPGALLLLPGDVGPGRA